MKKLNFGISTGLMCCIFYLTGILGNLVATLLLSGYLLISEDFATDEQVKQVKTAILRTLLITLTVSGLTALFNLLPASVNFINSIVSVFGGHFYISFISQFTSICLAALNVIKPALLIWLSITAFQGRNITVPVIDQIIEIRAKQQMEA